MKRRIILLGGLFAAFVGGQASAQVISGSPHDLSSGSIANGDKNEVCVYCHTPHGAATGVSAPLWNKPIVATAYTTYDSTTIDGEILSVGSVSVACLTCHDGTQARDAVINAPGTGLGTSPLGGLGTMPAGIANLGTDLSNDHPIGIQYGGFGTPQIDPDFTPVTKDAALDKWWVNTTATGSTAGRDKTDMILYTRDNGGTAEPFVECASCHDPHVGAADDISGGNNIGGSTISFMRISNENSDVCLACHTK